MKNKNKHVWTEMSQEDVAKVMGISRTRVYQIEKSALKKIKKFIEAKPRLIALLDDILNE